ncbi:MAG: S8/S53 family peptidase [Bacteroidales bacterium]|nr:S8/S53 family peptidase [Bacteroidales bacterium]
MKQFFLSIFLSFFSFVAMSQNVYDSNAGLIDNTLILKIKEEYRFHSAGNNIENARFQMIAHELGVVSLKKIFPFAKALQEKKNQWGETLVDLSLIYELKYDSPVSLRKAQSMISNIGIFEYVDFKHFYKPMNVPNDPNNGSQYHLNTIRAYDAWDISKGDSSVVIAIIDTGMDFNHLDLKDNVAYNYADVIDGIDNDNDGYIDNFRGWDFGTDDNNPQIVYGGHGVFVAGLAAAHTDNGIGISGVGYNSRFLPIKIANADDKLVNAFEAIVYAANQGAAIINCSWGGANESGSLFEQDVINYATFNKGSLVIAACGNDNNEVPFFPASYKNVMSVSMTDINDVKGTASSYGYYVDIAAPGQAVYSSTPGNNYATSSGTSFATSIVAGCAAILKSYFPNLSPLQIAERLRITSDNIDTLAANQAYAKKLGLGRVNLFNALTFPDLPSVRLVDAVIVGGKEIQDVKAGDTIVLMPVFKNYLAEVSDLTVRLLPLTSEISILNPEHQFDFVNTMTEFSPSEAFLVVIGENAPLDFWVNLKFEFESTDYYSYDYLQYNVNRTYIPIDENLILSSFTADGKLGFADHLFSMGNGFKYQQSSTLFSMGGFMFGKSTTHVSNNVYAQNGYDNDFQNLVLPYKSTSPIMADFEAHTVFNDNKAMLNKLSVDVHHSVLAWNNPQDEKFIIHEFTLVNKSSHEFQDFYAGMYIDWDIDPSPYNKIKYDVAKRLFYVWSPMSTVFGGISVLSDLPFKRYAMDNNGQNLSLKISDGFTVAEKYTAMSTNRDSAGFSGSGNDVSTLMSYGPLTISSGDSIVLAFALIAGDNPLDIQQSSQRAYEKYHNASEVSESLSQINMFELSPNPVEQDVWIDFRGEVQNSVQLTIYNLEGKLLYTAEFAQQNRIKIDLSGFSKGVYILKAVSDNRSFVRKIIKK